jgi:hypothetical protein
VLLLDKGWSWMKIADSLVLSEEVLRDYLKEFLASRELKLEYGVSKEV